MGIRRVKLGSQGLEVSKQGLGCMGMSAFYGPPKPEEDMIQLIHKVVDSGVTFLDTSDVYGPHANEILLGKAIKGIRDKVQLATKFAIQIDEHLNLSTRGDPEYVRAACEASLKRLDVEYIDLYYQHRVDTEIPIEITVGAMKKLVEEGKVKYLGLSEASASDIRRAHSVHPITAVQLEWSLWSRDVEEEIIPTCRELGIGIVVYSPLGRGFFSGVAADTLADGDSRKVFPRFGDNKAVFEKLSSLASGKGCTPGQLALAWVNSRGDDVVPIPGTTKLKNFEENLGSLDVELNPEEVAELETIMAMVKGARYDDGNMSKTWNFASTPPLSSYKA